jgi:predicted small integral membrane protein
MLIVRTAKILIALSLAGFCLLVAFDNVTDPRANYDFVSHVMRMDTIFPDSTIMYRSVTNPVW